MLSLSDYLDVAKRRHGCESERALARALGINPTFLMHLRRGINLPSDATMLRLADLAGLDDMQALIDLNTWRSREDAVKSRYEQIARILQLAKRSAAAVALTIAAVSFPTPGTNAAQASGELHQLYIMRGRRPRRTPLAVDHPAANAA